MRQTVTEIQHEIAEIKRKDANDDKRISRIEFLHEFLGCNTGHRKVFDKDMEVL